MKGLFKKLIVLMCVLTLCMGTFAVDSNADTTTNNATDNAKIDAEINKMLIEDATVLVKFEEFKKLYPQGTAWNFANTYKTVSKGRANSGIVSACQAFGYFLQDYLFGSIKVKAKVTGLESWVNNYWIPNFGAYQYGTKYYEETGSNGAWEILNYDGTDPKVNGNFEKIYANLRVGDIVQSCIHMGVVIAKTDTEITIAEGGYNGKINYGRRITKESLRKALMRVESAYK